MFTMLSSMEKDDPAPPEDPTFGATRGIGSAGESSSSLASYWACHLYEHMYHQ